MSVSLGTMKLMTMDEYLQVQALSASIVKTILSECPRAAWWKSWLNPYYEPEISDEMDIGTVVHSILLDGHSDMVERIDPADYPAEKTGNIPAGWTNKGIREARDTARALGKIPMLAADMDIVDAIVASARDYIESLREEEPAVWTAFQPDGGESERTFGWQDGATPCKMRPDRISNDRRLIVDLKTTKRSAEPDSWCRMQLVGMGYYKSAAFYRRGIEALFNVSPDYVFLVIQTEPPYLCSLIGMDPRSFELGAMEIERGMRMWASCMKSGKWPGYPTRCVYPQIPEWEAARVQERELSGAYDELQAEHGLQA